MNKSISNVTSKVKDKNLFVVIAIKVVSCWSGTTYSIVVENYLLALLCRMKIKTFKFTLKKCIDYTGVYFFNFFTSQEEELIILVAFFLQITNI